MDGTVADSVGCELDVATEAGTSELVEALGIDVAHATVFGVVDRIDFAFAPGFAHEGGAGEHAAIEKDFEAAEPEHVVVIVERVCGDAGDFGFDWRPVAIGAGEVVVEEDATGEGVVFAELTVDLDMAGSGGAVSEGRDAE